MLLSLSRTARPLALVLGVLAALALLLPTTATPAEASTRAETELVRLVNAERAKAGLPALRTNAELSKVARSWSTKMASRDRLYHRPDLARAITKRVTSRWTRAGENVAFSRVSGASETELARRIHRNLLASSAHRRNIRGDYNRIGIGVVVDSRGTMWVTQNFIKVR